MRKAYLTTEALVGIKIAFPSVEYDAEAARPALYIGADELVAFLTFLRDDTALQLTRMENVTAVDWKDHFEMVYHLYNMEENVKLEVKAALDSAAPVIESATAVYPGAEFEEREVYDLMGVEFLGHPDLRRILMPDNYPAHPLRKDFVAPVPKMEGGKLVWLEKAPTS